MTVEVYAKDGCKTCEAAKDKLRIMGIEFLTHDLQKVLEGRDGWREDGSAEILATFAMADSVPPVIRVSGVYHDYAGAMRTIKDSRAAVRSPAEGAAPRAPQADERQDAAQVH